MELQVLDTDLVETIIIDTFKSLIWTDRYDSFGDFELTASPSSIMTNALTVVDNADIYLTLADSEHFMIVDTVNIKADLTDGDSLIVKGKSAESILYRRIIWNKTVLTGNLQTEIHRLLTENAIDCTDAARNIPGLIFEESTDPVITALTIDTQFFGQYLYDAIFSLCVTNNLGFKITLSETNQFVFKLYSGVDRSYDQTLNPYIVFSPDNENLSKSDYVSSNATLKTVTLISGQGEGNSLVTTISESQTPPGTGLARREMFTDATSIARATPEGILNEIDYLANLNQTGQDYIAQIKQSGLENLAINKSVHTFTGEIDPTQMYTYNVDYFMGDLVQVEDDYGHQAKSRVIEYIHSQDETGTKNYPTFSAFME